MIRFLLSAVILLASSAVIWAAPLPDTHPFTGEAYGVVQTEKRIVELPQDGDKPYVSIMGDPRDPKFHEVVKWFETNETLKSVKAQTHYRVYTTSDPTYKARYAGSLPALPAIRVQNAQGERLYQASGGNLPMTGEAVANVFTTECFRRWCRPAPQPEPEPDYEPYVPPSPDQPVPQPDVQPDVVPASSTNDLAVILASILVGLTGGGIGGLVRGYKDQHYPKDK